MKKILTLLAVAVALLTTVPAQAQVKFGLKGGVNVTNMSFSSDVLDATNRAGFFIGPTVKFTLPIVGLGVDASALYDQREGKAKISAICNNSVGILSLYSFPIKFRISYTSE